jgi:hypothetical protein
LAIAGQPVDHAINVPLKGLAHVPLAVEGGRVHDGDLEQGIVAGDPRPDQRVVGGKPPGLVHQVGVIIQHRPVADDHLVLRRRGDFIGDLGVQNPRLGGERGVAIDRERTSPRHFLDQVDRPVLPLEPGGEIVAQRRLAHAMRADERDFQG